MNKLVGLLPLALALAACGSSQAPAPGSESASTAAPTAAAPLDQPAQPTPPQSAQELFAARIDAVLAGSWRSEANKARDVWRHPKETIEFFGVKPTDTLIEITPGAGWYTEVLAPLLKGSGTYIAAVAADASSDYAKKSNENYRALLAKDVDVFGTVKLTEFDPKAPVLGAPASADTVLTFRNVHNWAMGGTAPAMFKAFFEVLKPGGTLGVADHRASAGEDFDKVKDSGYLPTDYVIKLATDAGFKLVAQSEINANPKDDHHHEKGVWTLPPTLALGEQDVQKYHDIGESDRMTLKFEKPAGDQVFKTRD